MKEEDISAFSYRISQATGTELVVILYEMAQQYIDDAQDMYSQGSREEFRRYVKLAKRVTDELKVSLEMKYPISAQLFNIYSYASSTLQTAMNRYDNANLDVVKRIYGRLAQAFSDIADQDEGGPLMENTQKVYAGLTYSNGKLNEIAYDVSGAQSRGFTV